MVSIPGQCPVAVLVVLALMARFSRKWLLTKRALSKITVELQKILSKVPDIPGIHELPTLFFSIT